MNQHRKYVFTARVKQQPQPEARAISAYSQFRRPVYIFGKPVAKDIIFTNHRNIYKKKVENRQRLLMVKIPFINSFLEDGELIMLVTSGYAPLTRLERFLLRYLTVFQRRALFVFTNHRMLYIPTTFTYDYRYSIAEIRYADCHSIEVSGRSLFFIFHNGESQIFPYIGRMERRKLHSLLGELPVGENPSGTQNMTYLCAQCNTPIPQDSPACPNCRLQFWTAAEAGKKALLIPGGGYFYMGNTLYGVASAILEILLAVLLILSAVDMYHGLKGSVIAVTFLSMALAGLKAVTFFHAQELVQGCFPVMGRPSSVKPYRRMIYASTKGDLT